MKLFTLVLKNFLYFLKRKLFLYLQKQNPALFTPSMKSKKNPCQKKFLILQDMKLLGSNIKKCQEIETTPSPHPHQKKKSLYFRKREPGENFLHFLKIKLFLYFRKRKLRNENPKKASYISGDNFQSLLIKNFLYFFL